MEMMVFIENIDEPNKNFNTLKFVQGINRSKDCFETFTQVIKESI